MSWSLRLAVRTKLLGSAVLMTSYLHRRQDPLIENTLADAADLIMMVSRRFVEAHTGELVVSTVITGMSRGNGAV
jgi:hypothetical protein